MGKCEWWWCKEKAEEGKRFCGKACANKYAVDLRRRKVKHLLVKHFGGKCVRCGYDRCIEALEFHHRDPSTKVRTVSTGNTSSFESSLAEAEKCDLVCANCHREIEAEPFKARWDRILAAA